MSQHYFAYRSCIINNKSYDLAPENPLILWNCGFEGVDFTLSADQGFKVYQLYQEMLYQQAIASALHKSVLTFVCEHPLDKPPAGGLGNLEVYKALDDELLKKRKFTKIRDRSTAFSAEESIERLKGKKKEQYLKKLELRAKNQKDDDDLEQQWQQ
eukprot:TRINITY_DN4478_c0_g1_i3.p1 TRINITY_DN4478_c0_g1~~TRINITY_DN4478_c0_g1_i3.p1  ORF type:complete len:156 (-),score=5.08 TRINITY_DN4478_c0_g1_i3:158-625(-)